MIRKKVNHLLQSIISEFSKSAPGAVLDLGCGDGDYACAFDRMGFTVCAADLDAERYRFKETISFKNCDLTKKLPFPDCSFDYVLLIEVIEHLKNPYSVVSEINRVLRNEGKLILSTPNILNLRSRLRFLLEGGYEFFREPPLDQVDNPREKIFNLHVCPYRYHELEYLLKECGFIVNRVFTSVRERYYLAGLVPFIAVQLFLKQRRSKNKGGLDYTRINNILLSRDILFGRHLVIQAVKN